MSNSRRGPKSKCDIPDAYDLETASSLIGETYWKANPHNWGAGLIHVLNEDGTATLCGKRLETCPGRHIPAIEYTCRACAKVVETREYRKEREREWKTRQDQYEAEREAADRAWWKRYNAYLSSPAWAQKRKAVLARANGRCEACGYKRATQVHHTSYKHLGDEPLFELRAICYECHSRITAADRRIQK